MASQADAIEKSLLREIAKAGQALVLEIDAELRKPPSEGGTPVDTGHARANWVPSVGNPFTAEVDGNAAHENGVQALVRYRLEDGPLWLSNNVPYINWLDLATASAGFVEAAIARAQAAVQAQYDRLDIQVQTQGVGTFADVAGGFAASNLASAYSPFGGDT
ncbi:MAG: hypothetical protein H0U12_07145 [Thermoleophilaceae bacterium]|nr:hypothetical protein [Thermoleophilaceae bacterium]